MELKEEGRSRVMDFLRVMVVSLLVSVLLVLLIFGLGYADGGSISSGLSIREGNEDIGELFSSLEYRSGELELGGDYSFSSSGGEKVGERLYSYIGMEGLGEGVYYLMGLDFEYDFSIDLEHRIRFNPGIGYRIGGFSIDCGPSYSIEKYKGYLLEEDVLGRCRQRYRLELLSGVEFWEELELWMEDKELSDYILEGRLGIKVKVTERLSVINKVENRYKSEVLVDQEHNDLRIYSGISFDF